MLERFERLQILPFLHNRLTLKKDEEMMLGVGAQNCTIGADAVRWGGLSGDRKEHGRGAVGAAGPSRERPLRVWLPSARRHPRHDLPGVANEADLAVLPRPPKTTALLGG